MNRYLVFILSLILAACSNSEDEFLKAVNQGDVIAVRGYIDASGDTNVRGENNNTPLMMAVLTQNQALVELLVQNGAALGLKNDAGATAYSWAQETGSRQIVDILTKAIHEDSANLLELLEDKASLDVIKAMAAGMYLNMPLGGRNVIWNGLKGQGSTLLIAAISHEHWEAVPLLLDLGADVNFSTDRGYTALMAAASVGNNEMVSTLIDRGADVNANARGESTALGIATGAENQGVIVMNTLIENGADVNLGGTNTFPVMLATKIGKVDALKILIDHGANVNALGGNNKTSLAMAVENGDKKTAEALIGGGAEVNAERNPILQIAIKNNDMDMAKFLVESGVDLNAASGQHNQTPLMSAVINKNMPAINLLLDNGADVNARGSSGGNVLTVIPFIKERLVRMEVTLLLIDAGADVDMRNRDGLTPLMHAVMAGQEGFAEILIKYDADVNAKSKYIQSLYNVATSRSMRNFLKSHGVEK